MPAIEKTCRAGAGKPMKIHKESKEGACVTEKVLVQYMTNKNRRRRRGRRRGCTEDHAKMLKSAGFELSDWALPVAALSLVALAVLVFFLVRLLRPLLSRMGMGKKESAQERMEGLRQAAGADRAPLRTGRGRREGHRPLRRGQGGRRSPAQHGLQRRRTDEPDPGGAGKGGGAAGTVGQRGARIIRTDR